jgi:LysM repeat protein
VTPTSVAQMEISLAEAWALEDWEQAIDLIEQILAIEPDYPDMTEKLYAAHVNYGDQLLEAGDPDGATTQFSNALEVKPDGVEAQAGLAQAMAWAPTPTPVTVPTSTPPGALTVQEQLEQSLHESWAVASDDDKRAEEWAEVIGLIEQILAISPGDASMTEKLYAAHVNYGQQLVAEGRLEEAKMEFTRALEVKPGGGEAVAELEALAAGTTPVPSATSTPQLQQGRIHVVQSGENLYRISLRYGTTVQAIMAANGLTNYNIYVGQRLYIPVQ